MENLEKYLTEVKKGIPDIEQRLNGGAEEGQLKQLAQKAGCELPAELIQLYRRFDGENMAGNIGFLAGLQFLPLEKVLSDLDFFRGVEDELTAMGTKAISEASMCGLNWIPIGFDCSRAWLAMDLSPTEGGTAGQIIAVDYDSDYCWLLADSLDALFDKMATWFQKGILTINKASSGEPIIIEKTGHLFNSLEELTAPEAIGENPEIVLPEGFWRQHYKQDGVPLDRLVKEKKMWIKEQDVDCKPFAHMENLKELIFHHCHLKNAGAIAQAPNLKSLIFVECSFDGEKLSALAQAPNLKELSLNVMSAAGLTELKGIKTLKSLRLRTVTDFDLQELAAFTGIQELGIEAMELHDGTFLGKMKNLKKLELNRHTLDNLYFLGSLTKLTEFRLASPAVNEDGLSEVRALVKLKEFIYPVKDLSIYKGHPALEKIGIAAGVTQGFEVFEGSKVNGFTIFGNVTNEDREETKRQMERYVKIYSYGSQGSQPM